MMNISLAWFKKKEIRPQIQYFQGKMSGHSFHPKLYQYVAVAPCSLLTELEPPVKVATKDLKKSKRIESKIIKKQALTVFRVQKC